MAVRSLVRSPGFSILAVLILALGIGATTAMFAITRTILVKPLAFRDPGQLVTIMFRVPQFSKQLSTVPANAQHYELWRDHARSLAEIAMLGPSSSILSGRGQAVQVGGARVTANFFRLLGVEPAFGRGFAPGEDQSGRNNVAVVSDHFWREKLGGSPDAVGSTIRLSGETFQVIGVMPSGFPAPSGRQLSEVEYLPERIDYWVPLVFSKDDLEPPLGNMNFIPIARLKPGVTPKQALAELTALEKVIAKRFPEPVEVDPVVQRVQEAMARDVRLPLLILMSAVTAVLLIVCINLMNLMLARATAQRREWAIRLAVGAGLRDVLRGVLLESLLLSLMGGVLGVLASSWLLVLVKLNAPVELPRVDELQVDPAAVLFALFLSGGSALLFGLLPAWRAARTDPQDALQSSGRSASDSRSGHRAGKVLVAAEVALSTMLLLSAGLLIRSFAAILAVDPGMNVQQTLTLRINLPPDKYQNRKDIQGFYRRLEEKASSLPGVRAAGSISDLPLTGENDENPITAGDRPAPPLAAWQIANYRTVSRGYFRAAGVPFREGAVFDEHGPDASEVVISESLAKRLWPGQRVVGRPLRIYGGDKQLFRIAGVAGSTHAASLTDSPTLIVYFPEWYREQRDMSLVVKTGNDPERLTPVIRRIVSHLEPEAAIPSVATIREVVAKSIAPQRFELILLVGFAASALILAMLGLYGVLAFVTARRTGEIGIRMALGARPSQMLSSVLRNGMAPVVAGIVIGLASTAAFARILERLLFQVHGLDPATYVAVTLSLLGVAVLACLMPARRAATLDPASALRHE